MDKLRDIAMEQARIYLSLGRSIYDSAACLAICRKFRDLWAISSELDKVTLRLGTTPLHDSYECQLYASDSALIEAGGRIIEAASLWEAALEAGVTEEELTECVRELESNETNFPTDPNDPNDPNEKIWKKLGDLREKEAIEEAENEC